MSTKQKCLLLSIITIMLLIVTACKKKESVVDPNTPTKPEQPVIPDVPKSDTKSYIPLLLQSDNEKIELKYAEDGLQLSEIKYSTGIREVITYKDKKPREYRRYLKDELIYSVDYILNTDGMPIQANRFQIELNGKVLIPLGSYQISYDEQKNIKSINWFDFKNNLQSSWQYTYNESQNLTHKTYTDKLPSNAEYAYDGKSGLLKNVTSVTLFSIENDAFFLINTKSNLSSIIFPGSPEKNISLINAYNTAGYPSSFSRIVGDNKTVYKITYR